MANCENISLKTAIFFNQYIANIALTTFQISTLSSRRKEQNSFCEEMSVS